VIVVVDYGVNNLASVVRAFRASGHEVTLSSDPAVVGRGSRVVMPGVGHFKQAAENLQVSGLGDVVREVAASGRPVLGICLGLQLFFEKSEEAPDAAGLGLLQGEVVKFRPRLPVPHVGWARVEGTAAGKAHAGIGVLLQGEPPFYYHVHSYHPHAVPPGDVLATADYGEVFPTLVGHGNVLGAQFHPEKSQRAGLALLDAFARWPA
jgi:glutamine amidotransferase